VRTSLLLASLEIREQRYDQAVRALLRIKDQDQAYVAESLDMLQQATQQGGASEAHVQAYLRECLALSPSISIVLVLASSIRASQGDEAMAKFIANHLKENPTIRGLSQLIDLHIDNASGVARQNLSILRSFTEALVADKPAYRCQECGFDGKHLHWHCPVCKQWGTIAAIFGLEGE
jgi:lipopolysaccharide biosynthesis regulator YciM